MIRASNLAARRPSSGSTVRLPPGAPGASGGFLALARGAKKRLRNYCTGRRRAHDGPACQTFTTMMRTRNRIDPQHRRSPAHPALPGVFKWPVEAPSLLHTHLEQRWRQPRPSGTKWSRTGVRARSSGVNGNLDPCGDRLGLAGTALPAENGHAIVAIVNTPVPIVDNPNRGDSIDDGPSTPVPS